MLRPAQHGDEAGRLLEQRHQALVFLLAVALGQHLPGSLDAGAVHAGHHAALVAHRRIREGEPGLLVEAVAVHQERQLFPIGALALQRTLDDGPDVVPDLAPDRLEGRSERRWMLFAQDVDIRVVVQETKFFAPGHEHRELRVQHQRHDRAQRLRPA